MGKLATLLVSVGMYLFSRFVIEFMFGVSLAFVFHKGFDTLVQGLLDKIKPSLGQLPVAVIQLIDLAGMSQVLSIVGSAYLTVSVIASLKVFISRLVGPSGVGGL